MCSLVTKNNATDVSSFEGVCNWHADSRNVYQSCCHRIECSFLYYKPPGSKNLAVGPTGLTTADHVSLRQPRTSTSDIFTCGII